MSQFEEEIRRMAANDQNMAATKEIANMVGAFFSVLRKEYDIDQMIAMNFTMMWIQLTMAKINNG